MTTIRNNIFASPAKLTDQEEFLTLFDNSAVTIERIVSHSQSSRPGFWYDQDEDEWVIVLRGAATLEFADGELVEMKKGDYLTIPSHTKHRVTQTSPETVWLAVHAVHGK